MASYIGQDFLGYEPTVTVDQVAEYTDMLTGAESVENQRMAAKKSWRESPVRSLLALWFFVLLLYSLLNVMFRRYTA